MQPLCIIYSTHGCMHTGVNVLNVVGTVISAQFGLSIELFLDLEKHGGQVLVQP